MPMRPIRLNLRAKVILTVSLFLVAVFVLSMYLSLSRNTSRLRSSLNEQSKSFASLATPPIGNTFLLYEDSGSIKIAQQVNKYLALDPDVIGLRIVSVDGKQLYASPDASRSAVPAGLAGSFSAEYIKNKSGYVRQVVEPFFEDSGAHRYSVVYDISTKRIEQNVSSSIRVVLYTGAIILLLGIVAASWALNALFIKPLRQVSRSADVISAGDYNQQIISSDKDEIGKLAHAVNRMADSLKADIVKLRDVDRLKSEFLMIASHNLRTPLTIMKGYIEMAKDAETVEQLKAIVAGTQDSVTRLNLLSEDLLTVSTLESGTEVMTKTATPLARFIDKTAADFKLLAEKNGLHWRLENDIPQDATAELNQPNLRTAFGNILDNAIKFTKEGGSVDVSAALRDGQLVFRVKDGGIGIREDELPKLFTKFHRGTDILTYNYEGVGLGLYLTKLIVDQHGGKIEVSSTVGKGSTFSVYLPLAAPVHDAHPPAA
jgi:signal transduction histidine kinase